MKWYSLLLHLVGIVATVIFVARALTEKKEGRVLVTFSDSHGLHSGDVPVLVIGAAVVAILGLRIVRQSR